MTSVAYSSGSSRAERCGLNRGGIRPLASLCLLALFFAGCSALLKRATYEEARAPEFDDPKIPLDVALVLGSVFVTRTHKDVDRNHGRDKPYHFQVNVGASMSELLHKGLQAAFRSATVSHEDRQAGRRSDVYVVPAIVDVSTSHSKVLTEKDCSYKEYFIQARLRLKLTLYDRWGTRLWTHQAQGLGGEVDNWSTWCSNGVNVGGAYEYYYAQAVAKAGSRALGKILNHASRGGTVRQYARGLRLMRAAVKERGPTGQAHDAILFMGRGPSTGDRQRHEHPFRSIQQRVQARVDRYLKVRDPIDIQDRIPPKVSKPVLPPPPRIVKDEFETNAMYRRRLQRRARSREATIQRIQQRYRKAVVLRNRRVLELQKERDRDILDIRRTLAARKKGLPTKMSGFIRAAFLRVMGIPQLENPRYDAESRTMYVDLRASDAAYSKKVQVKIPDLNAARRFKRNLRDVGVVMLFFITKRSIQLDRIQLVHDRRPHLAKLSDRDFRPQRVAVTLRERKVRFKAPPPLEVELQNPNLQDRYQVDILREGGRDDLAPRVARMKARPTAPGRWLFVIGIEDYRETYDVAHAKASAKLFERTARKAFGVSRAHTTLLLDDKATSGAIKDKLAALVGRVRPGDRIYFYYTGHGVPAPATGDSYILPSDKVVDFISRDKSFRLSNIYRTLTRSNASMVVVFIDACFSGSTDNVPLFTGVAPGLIRTKRVPFDKRRMVIFTASKSTQVANVYTQKRHRMFTYFLVKALLGSGRVSAMGLHQRIRGPVSRISRIRGDVYHQQPQLYGAAKASPY